ncbi:MAG TPA: sigma-70 family RNA polymerase sigma factor [Pyrinomonadaceae bacterium]|nr:sigma-70 family RNA polymerase sigma factor [Pyrinomonadaceae bacterium]
MTTFLFMGKQRELAARADYESTFASPRPAGTRISYTISNGAFQQVDSKVSLKKEWVLTKEAFDRFLTMLDRDREQAGRKYESVRLRLVRYFQWSGAIEPDTEADETINRVARKIAEGATVYNLNAYIHGVAKLVKAESLKSPIRKQQVLDEAYGIPASSLDDDLDASERRICLNRCLQRIPEESREIIIEYYQDEKTRKIECRKELAARLGITLNALRINAHRIRVSLERCVRECVAQCARAS